MSQNNCTTCVRPVQRDDLATATKRQIRYVTFSVQCLSERHVETYFDATLDEKDALNGFLEESRSLCRSRRMEKDKAVARRK